MSEQTRKGKVEARLGIEPSIAGFADRPVCRFAARRWFPLKESNLALLTQNQPSYL